MTPKDPFLEGTFWDKFWRPIRSRALLFTPENQDLSQKSGEPNRTGLPISQDNIQKDCQEKCPENVNKNAQKAHGFWTKEGVWEQRIGSGQGKSVLRESVPWSLESKVLVKDTAASANCLALARMGSPPHLIIQMLINVPVT